jgi:hypothetical protein
MNEEVQNTAMPSWLVGGLILIVIVLGGAMLFFLRRSSLTPTPSPTPLTSMPPSASGAPPAENCLISNLTITQPRPVEIAKFPLTVKGVVNNSKNLSCVWTLFEGQAATMQVKDSDGTVIGDGILMAKGDWMTEGPVDVEGQISLKQKPVGDTLMLVITEEDPSGMGEPEQISIELKQ